MQHQQAWRRLQTSRRDVMVAGSDIIDEQVNTLRACILGQAANVVKKLKLCLRSARWRPAS